MTTPLKPCPSCGDPDAQVNHVSLHHGWVRCPTCGMTGPEEQTHREAAAAWNALPRPSDVAALQARAEAGTDWRHHSGAIYTVRCVSNLSADRPGWPVMVSYIDEDGEEWCRPLVDFLAACEPVKGNSAAFSAEARGQWGPG